MDFQACWRYDNRGSGSPNQGLLVTGAAFWFVPGSTVAQRPPHES
jgi:hypothetical protein